MKELNPVNIIIDTNMDADDLGHRVVECVKQCCTEAKIINVIKLDFGDKHLSVESLGKTMQNLKQMFVDMGASNCLFVPVGEKMPFQDIHIDKIEVVDKDELDKTTT